MTLAQDLTGDIPEFLDPDDFGKTALYDGYIESAGGRTEVTKTINIIFDDPFEAVNPLTNEVELTKPQATASIADIPTGAHGETLTIGDIVYKIIGIQPDGTGMVTFELSKDAE